MIESTGSGGGLKLFCAGVGKNHPDITNASRRIKQSEIDRCAKNGVTVVTEVKVGYDGIVMSNKKGSPQLNLTKKQIFMALGKMVPVNGKMVSNPYQKWSEIDPNLPNAKIEVLGPPPTSGTRDAFTELAMRPGAKAFPELAAIRKAEGKKAFRKFADAVREDGAYIEAGENDKMIVNKLEANPDAFGVFGFSFLDQNADKPARKCRYRADLREHRLGQIRYPVVAGLYMKKAHVGVIPGIAEYAVARQRQRHWRRRLSHDEGADPAVGRTRRGCRATALRAWSWVVTIDGGRCRAGTGHRWPGDAVPGYFPTAVLLLIATGFYFGQARALNVVDGATAPCFPEWLCLASRSGAACRRCFCPSSGWAVKKRWLKAWCWPNCRSIPA